MMMIAHGIHVYELQFEMNVYDPYSCCCCCCWCCFGATQVVPKRSEQGLKP